MEKRQNSYYGASSLLTEKYQVFSIFEKPKSIENPSSDHISQGKMCKGDDKVCWDTGCGWCTSGCTSSCTDSCTKCTDCTSSCTDSCTRCIDCTSSCTDSCTGGCTSSCISGCTDSCTSSCTSGCTNSSIGPSQPSQIPGNPHPTIPHVVWSEKPGEVIPAPGYKWKYEDKPDNFDVKLRPELAGLKDEATWLPLGGWDEEQKENVLAALGGFKDSKVRAWLVANVDFELRKESAETSPFAGTSYLVFTSYFFSPDTSYAKRENLIAFEAGKVFFTEGAESLKKWLRDYKDKNLSLISDMKEAKYLKEDLTWIVDLPGQDENAMGYAFRAYALGLQLDSPKGQKAQQEFKKRIDSYLQGNR